MTIILVTPWGEQHGLINSMPNSVPFDDFKNFKPEMRDRLRKEKKDDERMVKGRYINHQEQENGRLDKPYCRYAGDPIRQYHLIHDHEYELPYGFIKEVNESFTVEREGLQAVGDKAVNESGEPLKRDRKKRIHEIVPLSF